MATKMNLVNNGASSSDSQTTMPPPVESNSVVDGAAISDDQNNIVPPPVESNLALDGAAIVDKQNNMPPPVVSNLNPMASEWKPAAAVPTVNTKPDDKLALFMTFSRGYPVNMEEVRTYFERKFGVNCVKNVFIEQPKRVGEQPKFGHVAFRAACIPLAVLHENGGNGEKARHYIGGRAVWFKKFRGDL